MTAFQDYNQRAQGAPTFTAELVASVSRRLDVPGTPGPISAGRNHRGGAAGGSRAGMANRHTAAEGRYTLYLDQMSCPPKPGSGQRW